MAYHIVLVDLGPADALDRVYVSDHLHGDIGKAYMRIGRSYQRGPIRWHGGDALRGNELAVHVQWVTLIDVLLAQHQRQAQDRADMGIHFSNDPKDTLPHLLLDWVKIRRD